MSVVVLHGNLFVILHFKKQAVLCLVSSFWPNGLLLPPCPLKGLINFVFYFSDWENVVEALGDSIVSVTSVEISFFMPIFLELYIKVEWCCLTWGIYARFVKKMKCSRTSENAPPCLKGCSPPWLKNRSRSPILDLDQLAQILNWTDLWLWSYRDDKAGHVCNLEGC